MPTRECYHCKQQIEEGEPHDCWTTTEAALTVETCIFLRRAVKAPQVRRSDRTSKTKVAHIIQIRHRDEVEAPLTDWLLEAYELSGGQAANAEPRKRTKKGTTKKRAKAVKRTRAG